MNATLPRSWFCLAILLFLLTGIEETYAKPDKTTVKVTLNLQDAKLSEVFDKLRDLTDYQFTYGEFVLRNSSTFDVSYEQEDLVKVLEHLGTQAGFTYTIEGKSIVITKIHIDPVPVSAQDIIVRGTVTDEAGLSIPGVTVVEKGTTNGTITDIDGKYTITLLEEAAFLLFSFIGYETQEIAVENRTLIDVRLQENIGELDEVVVIGYGQQSKTKVTGAISSVKASDINKYTAVSFDQQLAGKVSGVVINESSGQPGASAQVVIRGTGTLTAGTNPLIVVNGFPLTEGSSLNSINPQDIESIDILKDAASAAIYGSRAANGVILIRTKSGVTGTPKVTLNSYVGFQQRTDKVEFVDAYDAAQFFTEARDWGYVSRDPANRSITDNRETRLANGANRRELRLNYLDPYLNGEPGLTNTDWLGEALKTAPVINTVLTVSGANEKSNYYVSSGYFSQDGIAIGSGLERYSASANINSKLSRTFDFGISINTSYTMQDRNKAADWSQDPVGIANIMYPFFSPYNSDGSLNISEQIEANTPEDGALGENLVAIAKTLKDRRNEFRTFGNTFLKWEILKGLDLKSSLGADFRNRFDDFFTPSYVGQYRTPAPKPALSRERNQSIINYQIENTLNYVVDFNDHSLDFLLGQTYQKEGSNNTTVEGSGIPDDNIENIAGASSYSINANRYIWTQLSYFGRGQYFFRNKYLLSASIRRDGSSRFGSESKWGTFPSFSAGWVLSNEDFFPDQDLLTFAKIRASWGKSGNNQIGSYSSLALVTDSNYVNGGSLAPGFATSTSPNPRLSWETTNSYNFGLDAGLFSNQINLGVNYYRARTTDLLLDVPVPEQSGFSSSLTNIGEVENKGWEFDLSGKGFKMGAFNVGFNVNLSANKNKVLALAPDQEQIKTGRGGAFVTKVGGPIAEITGYQIEGIYKTQEEIDNSPNLPGTLTGDYIVADLNGDGKINSEDQKGFGTYAPDFTYGFGANINYKNFGLSFAFTGVEGRKIYDFDLAFIQEVGEGFAMPNQYYFDNRYHPINNPNGFLGQPNLGNFSSARRTTRTSSIYFYDADYLRLRNVNLSYTLPESFASQLSLENLRIYVNATNLFTLTGYRGWNPDATPSNVLESGYSQSNYPVARTVTVGLDIIF